MKKMIPFVCALFLVNLKMSFGQDSLFIHSATYYHFLRAVTSGDVFNNGRCTIVGGGNNYLMFLNYEDETISIVDILEVPFKNTNQIVIADADNDGFNELIVGGFDAWQDPGRVMIYQCLQNFVLEWDTTGFVLPTFCVDDLDNDESNELAVCDYEENPNANLLIFSYQSNFYHLDFSTVLVDQYGYSGVKFPTVGDYNGDGFYELAVAGDNGFTWLYGFNGISYAELNVLGPSPGGALQVTSGNVDDDPPEELLHGTNLGLVEVNKYSSGWNFNLYWAQDIGRLAYQIDVENIDQDPEKEFAVIHSNTDSYDDGQVSVFDNVSGNIQMVWHDTLGIGWGCIHLSDVDQDASVELLVTVNDSLMVYEYNGPVEGIDDNISKIPDQFLVLQNYPNPFNSNTMITYSIPSSNDVALTIYDMLGREIQTLKSEFENAGTHSKIFDASRLSTGIYFYEIRLGNELKRMNKMMLVK
jgi:hypothetical protein